MENVLITSLRNIATSRSFFRRATHKLANLLALKALEKLPQQSITVTTPIGLASGSLLVTEPVLVPILRSGLSLLPAFIDYFPSAAIGFIGLKRDKLNDQAHLYYKNLPPFTHTSRIIILDPMIATGSSICSAIEILIQQGAHEEHIFVVAIIASQDGVTRLTQMFPRVHLIIATIDDSLTENRYISPGLGDFGDRYFGTE